MGNDHENLLNIFKKEYIKSGSFDSIGGDSKDIIDLLTADYDESSLEDKIKKAKCEYTKKKFEIFCRKRFRLMFDNSVLKLQSENKLENNISKNINDLFNEYKKNILNTDVSIKEIREKVFKEVRLSQDVPEFIGEDMRSYGPFKKGEVISIPLRNAEILIREKLAEN